jgi:hypothetical protein
MVLQYVWLVPYLLVGLFGLVFAVVNMSRTPGPAMLAGAALAIMLLNLLGISFLQFAIVAGGLDGSGIPMIQLGLGFVRALVNAVAIGMLVVAVFMGRSAAPSAHNSMAGKPL